MRKGEKRGTKNIKQLSLTYCLLCDKHAQQCDRNYYHDFPDETWRLRSGKLLVPAPITQWS